MATEQKLRKMTSSSNLRYGNVCRHKLSEMTNQKFKVQGRNYQVLFNFGIYCRKLGGLKVTSFCACMHSFRSVENGNKSLPD